MTVLLGKKKKKKEQELENQTDVEWYLGGYANGPALHEI